MAIFKHNYKVDRPAATPRNASGLDIGTLFLNENGALLIKTHSHVVNLRTGYASDADFINVQEILTEGSIVTLTVGK